MLTGAVVTPVSGNAKTGAIAVTGRDRSSCPTTCAFYNGECYTTGRIDAYYARNARDWTLEELRDRLREAKSDRLRDRVDGDVLTDGKVDRDYLETLTDAAMAEGFQWVWGYSHSRDVTPEDVPDGYVMNASCETEDDVTRAIDLGMPAVITSHMHLHGDRIEGRPVVQCPATRADAINCGNCGGSAGPLCARKDRTAIILFPPHGAGAKKAAKAIEARYGLTY
jgi:hypothetical protein